jgi:K+-sensing histidine kinase KdpD
MIRDRPLGVRRTFAGWDVGAVILPEQVDRPFEPFQRVDRHRVDDHHGLGLAIAIAHDATLTANARPQGGLLVEIHSPLIPFAVPRWAAAETLGRPV